MEDRCRVGLLEVAGWAAVAKWHVARRLMLRR